MAIARLSGGPLDGQIIPLEPGVSDSLIVPYGEGQLIYRRAGSDANTGDHDGPTEARFVFDEATEDINPDPDGRDE
ncbi:response regulator [Microbacterium candidum]|uniref:Response regulator n=1 Tax=Microbacterium candidum TaxID=3041922 RepID=A0ABT7N3X0_9MICO|nr:response regulator [Microbacterium sp. ASV49]MDL9981386.1 response regulator [Microbacterium sp. ASV49]